MKKVCIYIHGFISDPSDFCGINQELKGYYDTQYFYKFPGHAGRKDSFSVETTLKELDEIINNYLNTGYEVDLCGFSLGGGLCQYLASIYNIHNMILLAPSISYINPKTIQNRIDYLADYRKIKDSEYKKYLTYDNNELLKCTKTFINNFKLPYYTVYKEFINLFKKETSFKCPCLIVWGKFDELVPMRSCLDILKKSQNKNSYMVVIPNTGHLMLRSARNCAIVKVIKTYLGI